MSGLVYYPFQLRPDVWTRFLLPSDLNADDVRRIVATLQTMVESPQAVDAVDPQVSDTGTPTTRVNTRTDADVEDDLRALREEAE